MKKFTLTSLVLLMTLFSSPTKAAKKGAYVGAGLGTQKSGRIYSGYRFDKHLAVELGYTTYTQKKIQAVDVIGKTHFPIGKSGFGVYGLGGAAAIKSSQPPTQTRIRPKIGVGMDYEIDKNFSAGLEYSRIQGIGDKYNRKIMPNIESIAFTLTYTFQ